MPTTERGWMKDYLPEQASLPELPYAQCPYPSRSLSWAQGPNMDNGRPNTTAYIFTCVRESNVVCAAVMYL